MGHWKKVSEGGRLEKNMFWPVLTCFWPVYLQFDGFFGFSKKSGRDCRKNFFWPKSDSSHVKRDIKAKKKKHPLCLKNPAEIQEMSFGQGRSLFFNLFLAYTTQLECKIISPGDHQLMLSWNTQGWLKRMGRVGVCPPRFWQKRRCGGDVPNYYFWFILDN